MSSENDLTAIVVSHTHWDRAWYLSFQAFRQRLISLVDRIIELLDNGKDYESFTLDGQTVLLEDYLELRPDKADALKHLIASHRIHVGPWYILPDLFLSSGEAILRNLKIGHEMGLEFGRLMRVGYVPDPFGHIAQLPQILSQFGIDSFIFMRGMPEEEADRLGNIFTWKAPDGSEVLSIYQRDGYYNASALGYEEDFGRYDLCVPDLDKAANQIEETSRHLSENQQESVILLNNGMDHMPEQPDVATILGEVEPQLDNITLEHANLEYYVERVKELAVEHESFEGDLIGNAHHPILLNVYSTRLYLKQQNHRAQSLLEKFVEPFQLLASEQGGETDPHSMRLAWRYLLRNHPHDDICGCSIDPVHRDNEHRFLQVEEIGKELIRKSMETMVLEGFEPASLPEDSENTAKASLLLYNPHPFAVTQKLETDVVIPFPEDKAEELQKNPPAARVLKGFDADGREFPVEIIEEEAPFLRTAYLEQTWGHRYRIRFTQELPAAGYELVTITEDSDRKWEKQEPASEPRLENDHFRLQLENEELVLTDKKSGKSYTDLLRFEYQKDFGDTYSFSPQKNPNITWAELVVVSKAQDDANALEAEYFLPAIENGRNGSDGITIHARIRLEKDWISFRTHHQNTLSNGRIRACIPTHIATKTALSDAHFRLAERTCPPLITPEEAPDRYENYPGELNYPTRHQNDFSIIESDEGDGVWFANRGLHEFELIDDPFEEKDSLYAVTIQRSVGYLSVGNGRIRKPQAGPAVATPEAQCHRPMEAEFCMGIEQTVDAAEIAPKARTFAHPPKAMALPYLKGDSGKSGPVSRRKSLLEIDNPNIQLSAFKPSDDGQYYVLRIYNLSDEPQQAELKFGVNVSECGPSNPLEQPADGSFEPIPNGTLELEVPAHKIYTLLLR